MEFQFSAGFVIFRGNNNQREYLLLHYPHGHWDLPKGKMEKGESKQQTAIRELKEETGLDPHVTNDFEEQLTYFFRQDGQLIKKTVYFFIARVSADATVALSHEHIGYEWLPFDEALARLSFDNAKDIMKKVENFLTQNNK